MTDRNSFLTVPLDGDIRGRAYATAEELAELGAACRNCGVSEQTRLLLARLASYPPPVRLAINLKTIIGLMIRGPLYNVLKEGLLPEEYIALAELDLCCLPPRMREIAHGLFNVHERWRTMVAARSLFKAAVAVKGEFLTPKTESP